MTSELQDILDELQRIPPAQLTGAVKTHPLRELLKKEKLVQIALLRKETPPQEVQALKTAYTQLQHIIIKRIEIAHQLVEKFLETTPEVISLHNSVFNLVPSRDLLEDAKAAFQSSSKQFENLTKANANIFEAVNIEIQQKFYQLSPEAIAVHYSTQELQAYRKLLKSLLAHIDVDSDIFKVYNTIIRNVVEGSKIHKMHIGVAKNLCARVFQSMPPAYDAVLNQCTTEELDSHAKMLRASLSILERDFTGRPSVVEFTEQCRQLLHVIPEHLAARKVSMRKTTRILQLAHHIEFLSPEQIAANATITLVLCQILFAETRQFLLNQQTHLDVALNIKSLEDAQRKVEESLQYRQYAVSQLFREIATRSAAELSAGSAQRLEESLQVLQEIQTLADDFMRRSPSVPPANIRAFAKSLQGHLKKLQDAIVILRKSPPSSTAQLLELERLLPNLTRFYDEELEELLRKALKVSVAGDIATENLVENIALIPVERLQEYLESLMRSVQTAKATR
jgi:hypothetical protein